jgi:ubiquinone/menaquinone biosynthesis C-methylase UbiE
VLNVLRQTEVGKYEQCYRSADYRMGSRRKNHVDLALRTLEKGSLLDVGCGRGETIRMAEELGFTDVRGLEAVDYLCDDHQVVNGLAHAIPFPDKSFDAVTMFDVIEHLVPEDTDAVCSELERVARKYVLLTVHNGPSKHNGVELHINLKDSYQSWFEYFAQKFSGNVEWLPRHGSISEMFKVTYGSR